MVYISTSTTTAVNPRTASSSSSDPKLSIDDLFAALVHKARHPEGFVAAIESSSIISEHEGGLTRRVVFKPGFMGKTEKQVVEEVVEFFPPTRVDFKVPATGMQVSNVISHEADKEDELYLTFSFDFPHPEITDRKAQKEEVERLEREARKGGSQVVPHTIQVARQMKIDGKL